MEFKPGSVMFSKPFIGFLDLIVPVFQGESGAPGPAGRRGTRGIPVSTFWFTVWKKNVVT